MLSLKLFNAVLRDDRTGQNSVARVEDTLPLGYLIAPSAAHLADKIVVYYEREQLNGRQLNQTFHKSWETVQKSSRDELLGHQLMHYFSTYGFELLGIESDFIYLPAEVSEVPELKKAPVRVIHGLSADELATRAMELLNTGVALAGETINDLLSFLQQIDRLPKTTEGIHNREALVLLGDKFDILPNQPVEFLRLLIFKATQQSLLIKDKATIEAIKQSEFDISHLAQSFGLERCAEIFNRFKPLWLAFKAYSPNVATVNRIGKLSKQYHRPMPQDYLNTVTAATEFDPAELEVALDKVNNFRKVRLLYALNTRLTEGNSLIYRIRSGKSFVKFKEDTGGTRLSDLISKGKKVFDRISRKEMEAEDNHFMDAYLIVWNKLVSSLAEKVNGQRILLDRDVHYTIPASEKMFVGNLPVGSYVESENPLTVGVYWRNEWGARDLDLSGLAISKVGWNGQYNQAGVTYSGDITDAPNGATELLRFTNKVQEPYLLKLNVYSGSQQSGYKLIIDEAAEVSANYMFKPDELRCEVRLETNQRQQDLGIYLPGKQRHRFVIANVGSGSSRVSASGIEQARRAALLRQWSDAPLLADLLQAAGAELVYAADEAEIDTDLRWQNLAKDSILQFFA